MIKVSHDYLDPSFISDPYPYFKKIREEMPVHWNERWRGWIMTRYDERLRGAHALGRPVRPRDVSKTVGEIAAIRSMETSDGATAHPAESAPASARPRTVRLMTTPLQPTKQMRGHTMNKRALPDEAYIFTDLYGGIENALRDTGFRKQHLARAEADWGKFAPE
jgi:hypothetical protein